MMILPHVILVDLIVNRQHGQCVHHNLLGAPFQARPVQHLQQCDNAKLASDGTLTGV